MYRKQRYRSISVALLIVGSAILLISCDGKKQTGDGIQENILTGRSDTLTRYETENGVLKNKFYTPLMEEYRYAPEPYTVFDRGIDIVSYDSLGQVKSTLVGDYAINYTNLKLWEVRGNVRATNNDGQAFETNQLYWNQVTKKIYSNVDTDIFLGDDILRSHGFESDEDMKDWVLRSSRGTFRVDTAPTRDSAVVARDSLAVDSMGRPAAPVVAPGAGDTGNGQEIAPSEPSAPEPGDNPEMQCAWDLSAVATEREEGRP